MYNMFCFPPVIYAILMNPIFDKYLGVACGVTTRLGKEHIAVLSAFPPFPTVSLNIYVLFVFNP